MVDETIAALRSEPVAIGEMNEGGVYWHNQNPHAYPIGTKFYAAPSREDRAEPVAGQLSAETIEEWREWWHNMPYKDGEIAQVNQICDAALSSLRGTFADGIEAVLSDAELHLSERQRSRIRALAQGQRPSEQDADELPVHVADALIHQIKSGASFDRSVMLIALGQLRAHLSRKEPK